MGFGFFSAGVFEGVEGFAGAVVGFGEFGYGGVDCAGAVGFVLVVGFAFWEEAVVAEDVHALEGLDAGDEGFFGEVGGE